jgi:beta propeller repeat protein
VWSDNRNGSSEIYLYDLSTDLEMKISFDGFAQYESTIFNDKIVWHDFRNLNHDIFIYNITNGKELQITSNNSNQLNSAIYNNIIIWEDERNGNKDIYTFELITCRETPLGTNLANQEYLGIFEDKVVWMDNRNGDWDIYMMIMDKDNDGYSNSEDAFPDTPYEFSDTDGDGIGDNLDPDADNDGWNDELEVSCGSDFLDALSTPANSDDDIVPDSLDPDDDNDGYPDINDSFPLDPTEWHDFDNDGIGDNTDLDDDNDGIVDDLDQHPLNPLNDLESILLDELDVLNNSIVTLSSLVEDQHNLTKRELLAELENVLNQLNGVDNNLTSVISCYIYCISNINRPFIKRK